MHKVINSTATQRRHLGQHGARHHAPGVSAIPRVHTRQMHGLQQGGSPAPDSAGRSAATSAVPLLHAPAQAHTLLPTHDAIVKSARSSIPALEERYVDSLQLRLQASLLNAHCYNRFAPELLDLLTRTGLDEREAAAIAGNMLKLLVQDRPRRMIERDLRALIDTMMIAGHPELTVELALQHQLMLKAYQRLTQLLDHARALVQTTANAIDWGEGLQTFSSYSPEVMQKGVRSVPLPSRWGTASPQLEAGRYQAALSFDMLHRSPDIDASLQQIHASLLAGGRIYALETVLSGPSSRDAERDRGRTLLHDYLLHWLLHPEKVPVNGNYLNIDHWPNRLEQNGFKVCEVVDLGVGDAGPGNHEALYIAEKT
ncbi:hypothetical protein [Noviherbaspirillum pedocola]|uniref:Uncharacterized protein n=1 Tax=Noviherbaspirillum pedocola TaxID=2801341 RepID=A0A934W8K0_9BURK|nr:hypothetical protein [Noviherbaspirillum pedocola]MBK4736888.1 hypothetical protein [Noviherbaspirillum pedocola]